MREIALGVRRFDGLQEATGAPRAVLTARLRSLTEAGILAMRPYQLSGRRGRSEYVLTPAGLDLLPLLTALSDWGERHLGGDGDSDVDYRHVGCGRRVHTALRCECGAEPDLGRGLIAQVNR